MSAADQTTLASPATLSGVGLHSGVMARATLRPAGAGSGVVFRVAIGGAPPSLIRADAANVIDTRLCTRLGDGAGRSIGTIEHVLAALSICSVDNVLIDVDANEMPILDGSAAPYVEAIGRAGISPQQALRRAIVIDAPFEVVDGARSIRAEPDDGRLLSVEVKFEAGAIGAQGVRLNLGDQRDLVKLARARTFCRLSDVEAMRAKGLARGGSLDNAIVVDGARILNAGGLRDPDEFALHKALDLVGDLRLAGVEIIGRIAARRPGHDLNVRFVRALLASRDRR
jgi:UDP-3-O-[3-hydroxymyristoyl] N-acetylglucosamine deacetylase